MTPQDPDKKTAILDTALVLFTTRGFQGTPTALISREAGVATGTLFFYFKTKEELIDELYLRIKSEAGASLQDGIKNETTIKNKILKAGSNGISWGLKNPNKLLFLEQFAHSPFVSKNAHNEGMTHFLFLQDLITEGMRNGEIRNSDPRLLCTIIAFLLSGLISHVLAIHDETNRDLHITQALDILWDSIRNENRKQNSG